MLKAAQLALLTFMMSALDAGFTLEHMIRQVASEWNPIMDYLLHTYGVAGFIAGKTLVTGLALMFLVCFFEQKQAARWTLWGAFFAYVALTTYHVCIMVVTY